MDIEKAAEIAYGHLPREQNIVDALRKARKYIRTVEALRKEGLWPIGKIDETLNAWTEGDEIKAIEDALLELGIIV